jgi:hypothetical protein
MQGTSWARIQQLDFSFNLMWVDGDANQDMCRRVSPQSVDWRTYWFAHERQALLVGIAIQKGNCLRHRDASLPDETLGQ